MDKTIYITLICGISSEIYNKAGFEKYDRYSSQDLIKGTLESKNSFNLAEILTQNKYQDDEGHIYYQDAFSGLFMDAKLTKNINAFIYFRKDKGNNSIFSKIPFFDFSRDKMKVELDSPEFEEVFDVYSDNRMLTMQILSVDIMQMIIDFKREMKFDFEITIKENDLFIRFKCWRMFENGKIMEEALNKERLYKYYKTLEFSLKLSNMLIKSINDVIL